MSDPRPIGLFDSGVGGLSVLRHVRTELPREQLLYVADTLNIPYGEKSAEQIRALSLSATQFLLSHDIKLLIIACNSANAAALHFLRTEFPTSAIVGMEPAVKPAAERTRTNRIGVLMTRATAQGELLASVIGRFAVPREVEIIPVVCPELVTLVEQGAPDTDHTRAIIREAVAPITATDADQVVLACTHFPFLIDHLQAELGSHVQIIDPALAVARRAASLLEESDKSALLDQVGSVRYFTSGDRERFRQVASRLIGEVGIVEQF